MISNRENFLEPEMRDGTYVSAELKAIWKVLLDILEVIMRVCEKYDLKYTLEGGSLLGAIRHKGFVPWDDDIDVVMPRKDYDKLVEVMPNELPSHLFMQTTATEAGFHIPHIMVRDSRTTGIDIDHVRWGKAFNMGLRVDVLALDGMPDTKLMRKVIEIGVKFFKMVVPRDSRPIAVKSFRVRIHRIIGFVLLHVLGRRRIYECREWFLRRCSLSGHKYCGSLVARNFWHPHSVRETAWFRSYKLVPFEYLEVPVPIDSEKILTQQFGDWKVPVRGGSRHGVLIADTKTDYKTYLMEHYDYKMSDFD